MRTEQEIKRVHDLIVSCRKSVFIAVGLSDESMRRLIGLNAVLCWHLHHADGMVVEISVNLLYFALKDPYRHDSLPRVERARALFADAAKESPLPQMREISQAGIVTFDWILNAPGGAPCEAALAELEKLVKKHGLVPQSVQHN